MRLFAAFVYYYCWGAFNLIMFYFYRFKRWKHVRGLENVPNNGPVILCSNHTNAFMDPIMLGCAMNRRTWFLARSDVFRKKSLARFLGLLGIIPIYRLQEGVENLSRNDETFDKCAAMLEENKSIIIYSEGICVQERRLRKLKKGTARIAFGSEERHNFELGLKIVPVGMNYSATPWKFRSRMFINFGKAIDMKEYVEQYRNDKPRAINAFTKDLEDRMRELLITIERPENDLVVEQLEEMLFAKRTAEKGLDVSNPAHTHEVTTEIAGKVNRLERESPHAMKEFRHEVKVYFEELKKKKLRDWILNEDDHRRIGFFSAIMFILFFITALPFYLFGLITNYIPYKVPWLVTKKIVKQVEWSASINGTIGVVLWQIWWLLQSLAVALIFRNWYLLWGFMIMVPVCGVLAQAYWTYVKRFAGSVRWWMLGKEDTGKLQRMRAGILSRYSELP
ncbi:MAG TPA: 1-acyl-sn-glycerol-3-phosphate acyltransferase [Bacteroidia bacterium]|jgi:1-acyl-sn-glycerol-3-phosphate acyltransferase|nr:1-acyl-sn-glycerol-3-phosphate acyltransferase [Bacteroidia bacterium]